MLHSVCKIPMKPDYVSIVLRIVQSTNFLSLCGCSSEALIDKCLVAVMCAEELFSAASTEFSFDGKNASMWLKESLSYLTEQSWCRLTLRLPALPPTRAAAEPAPLVDRRPPKVHADTAHPVTRFLQALAAQQPKRSSIIAALYAAPIKRIILTLCYCVPP